MPFLLIFLGIVLIMSAINGRHRELGDLWKGQLQGEGSFLALAMVLLLLGALGAINALKPLAIAFMSLILIVIVLTNSGTTESTSIIGRLRSQLIGGS